MLIEASVRETCIRCLMISRLVIDLRLRPASARYVLIGKNAHILKYLCDSVRIYKLFASPSAMLTLLIPFDEVQWISGLFLEHWTSLIKFGKWEDISGSVFRKDESTTVSLLLNSPKLTFQTFIYSFWNDAIAIYEFLPLPFTEVWKQFRLTNFLC